MQRVNTATSEMVRSSQRQMAWTGVTLMRTRQRSTRILIFVAGMGLSGMVGLMYFYVNRHVINQLSWLSSAMQSVAAGRLDILLPPAGSSELGRLDAGHERTGAGRTFPRLLSFAATRLAQFPR